ncbi:DEKNAAC103866, partial [Brettanomyces naardenensis]
MKVCSLIWLVLFQVELAFAASTISTSWTGTVTSTLTTETAVTNSFGQTTSSTIIVVETPTPVASPTTSIATQDINSAVACFPGSGVTTQTGFNVDVYPYPFANTALKTQTNFLASLYTTGGLVTTATGVTAPQFSWTGALTETAFTTLYGADVQVSNLVMSYTGYMLATESGVYTFDLNKIDDAVMVFMGSGLDCCMYGEIDGDASQAIVTAIKATTGSNASVAGIGYRYLEADTYYPIRITYVNSGPFIAALDFSVVSPSGEVFSNFTNVFQFSGIASGCSSSIISLPVTTTTEITTDSNGNTETTTIVIIETPTPLLTTTTPWTGTFTSTTTSETVETDSNGSSFTTSIVVIDTPTSALSTITTPWT